MHLPAPDDPAVLALARQIARDLGRPMGEAIEAARGAVGEALDFGVPLPLPALIAAALVRGEGEG